jgi:hypothetical protein
VPWTEGGPAGEGLHAVADRPLGLVRERLEELVGAVEGGGGAGAEEAERTVRKRRELALIKISEEKRRRGKEEDGL